MNVTVAGDGVAGMMTTPHEWHDAPLDGAVRRNVEQIARQAGAAGHMSLLLFRGGDATHRQLAAALLGKSLGRNVYRVDLSAVTSKYIGETEKNLRRSLDRAQDEGAGGVEIRRDSSLHGRPNRPRT